MYIRRMVNVNVCRIFRKPTRNKNELGGEGGCVCVIIVGWIFFHSKKTENYFNYSFITFFLSIEVVIRRLFL